jgi:hypothetical protein
MHSRRARDVGEQFRHEWSAADRIPLAALFQPCGKGDEIGTLAIFDNPASESERLSVRRNMEVAFDHSRAAANLCHLNRREHEAR